MADDKAPTQRPEGATIGATLPLENPKGNGACGTAAGLGETLAVQPPRQPGAGVHFALTMNPGDVPQPAPPAPVKAAGRYQLQGELARGGMGAVLAARDPSLEREVAVKVLLPGTGDDGGTLARFVEEAQIAGQLQHPGIVPVYDLGKLADNRPFFAMKLVRGQTYAQMLAGRQDLLEDRTRHLKIFEHICQAIAYAHSRGVIHRDLKPHNVMVGSFGEVLVMDWGLAKVLGQSAAGLAAKPGAEGVVLTVRTGSGSGDTSGSLTELGSVIGTPAYMAPEQAQGNVEQLDERCDVFGLGAILCEILTGKPPYVKTEKSEVFNQAIRAELGPALTRLEASGAGPDLVDIARRSLSVNRDQRYRDASALAAELTKYFESVDQRVRLAELARAEARAKQAEADKRRRLTLALAGSIIAALILGGGGLFGIREQRAARVRATQTRLAADVERVERTLVEGLGRRDLARSAKSATAEQLPLWQQAQTVAAQAERLATALPAGHAARQRVADFVREVQREVQVAEHAADDARLARELWDIRSLMWDTPGPFKGADFESADKPYREAFAAHGYDILRGTPEEAAEVLSRLTPESRVDVALALDDWAYKQHMTKRPRESQRLLAIARLIDPDPLREQVRAAVADGDFEQLIRLSQSPEVLNAPAHTVHRVALALWQNVDIENSIRLTREGVRRHPHDFRLHQDLAFWLLNTRPIQAQEAARHATAAIALRPQSIGALSSLIQALSFSKNYPEIVELQHQIVTLQPQSLHPHRHMVLFDYLGHEGKADASVESYSELVRLRPEYFENHLGLSAAYGRLDKLAESKAAAEKAVSLAPGYGITHHYLGIACSELGEEEEALAAFRRAKQLDPEIMTAYHEARLFDKLGKWDEAIAAGEEIIRANPTWFELRHSQAARLRASGRHAAAIEQEIIVLANVPSHYDAARGLAVSLLASSNMDAILPLCASDRLPEVEMREVELSLAARLVYDGRLDDYRQLCQDVFRRRGQVQDSRGAYLLSRMASIGPDSGVAPAQMTALAEIPLALYRQGHFYHTAALAKYRAADDKGAEELLRQCQKVDPAWCPALNELLLALVLSRQGDREQAHAWYLAAEKHPIRIRTHHHHDAWAYPPLKREAEQALGIESKPPTP